MAVPYYIGYLTAVVDDGHALKITEPCKVYAAWQVESSRLTDIHLGKTPGEYGTMNNLPHLLVGSQKFRGNLFQFQVSVDEQVSKFKTGQLKELEAALKGNHTFEVIPISR